MQKNQKGFGAISILAVIVILALIIGLGFSIKSRQNKGSDSKTNENSIQQDVVSSGSNNNPAPSEYKIEELRLSITLTEETKDLTHKINERNGQSVYFSLKNFLEEAKAKNYPYAEGVCEEIALVSIYNKQKDIEAQENQVYGELLDDGGNPVSSEVIKLKDGRYALISGEQSSCGRHSSQGDEYQDLANHEVNIRRLLISLLQTNLKSTD